MEPLRGRFEQSIDEKGRLSVPGKWRDALRASEEGRLFLTNNTLGEVKLIDVVPYETWIKLEQRVLEATDLDPALERWLNDYYLAGVHESQIDKQGRILIPPRLRDYAGLKGEIVISGMIDRFRVLDRDSWAPVFSSAEQEKIKDPNLTKGFRFRL